LPIPEAQLFARILFDFATLKRDPRWAYAAAGFWGDETIYCLLARHARATPQAYAVRDHHLAAAA
jgi:non-ribosomal peptide synthetase component E (peptide arylation enzyme)